LGRRRVVITGLGVVAPNGIGKEAFWQNLVAGNSAVDDVSTFDASSFPCRVAAEIRGFRPGDFIKAQTVKNMGRFAQLAVVAARLAADDSKLSPVALAQAALCQGTAVQGIADLGETAYKEFLANGWRSVGASVGLEYTAHAATVHVQAELLTSGPTATFSAACCTGIDAIGWSVDQIQSGRVQFAVSGAAEAPLSPFIYSLFMAGGYLSTWKGPPTQASRPYDASHSGFVPAEGAATLVLEDLTHALDRGARIYAEVLGYATASESAVGMSRNSYTAALCQAIRAVLERSHLGPRDIDYICAHGNSIPEEDRAEAAAHRAAFGDHVYCIPISSIKSMIGQSFAASGLMQATAATLAVEMDVVPPTINCETPDPECGLDYVPNLSRRVRIRHALLHSHSLGGRLPGSHSALVIAKLRL
jgi:3-oxoacyl-[acyl-carrier-protein] synthase II